MTIPPRTTDLTGRRFGQLVVQHLALNKGNGHLYWHCRCDCGNTHVTRADQFRRGKVSCGCANTASMVGLRFGRLVVLSRDSRNHVDPRWLCRCDCGDTAVVIGRNLRCGNTRSCGCLRVEVSRLSRVTPAGRLAAERKGANA